MSRHLTLHNVHPDVFAQTREQLAGIGMHFNGTGEGDFVGKKIRGKFAHDPKTHDLTVTLLEVPNNLSPGYIAAVAIDLFEHHNQLRAGAGAVSGADAKLDAPQRGARV